MEILKDFSPDGRRELHIRGPSENSNHFYALFLSPDGVGRLGLRFGYRAEFSALRVDWSLPDEVCGIYLQDECYFLFTYAAKHRRRQERHRVGKRPFSAEEIDWFCAKKPIQPPPEIV